MSVCANDEHVCQFFLDDTHNFLCPVLVSQAGIDAESLLLELSPVKIQSLLVTSCLQIVTLATEHPGRGAFHNVNQQVGCVLFPLADGIGKQFLVMVTEIKGNGHSFESRRLKLLETFCLAVHLDVENGLPAGEPRKQEYVKQQQE